MHKIKTPGQEAFQSWWSSGPDNRQCNMASFDHDPLNVKWLRTAVIKSSLHHVFPNEWDLDLQNSDDNTDSDNAFFASIDRIRLQQVRSGSLRLCSTSNLFGQSAICRQGKFVPRKPWANST